MKSIPRCSAEVFCEAWPLIVNAKSEKIQDLIGICWKLGYSDSSACLMAVKDVFGDIFLVERGNQDPLYLYLKIEASENGDWITTSVIQWDTELDALANGDKFDWLMVAKWLKRLFVFGLLPPDPVAILLKAEMGARLNYNDPSRKFIDIPSYSGARWTFCQDLRCQEIDLGCQLLCSCSV